MIRLYITLLHKVLPQRNGRQHASGRPNAEEQKFTDAAEHRLEAGALFVEIAGNRQIIVTAIVPRDWSFQLLSGEVLTDGLSKRVVLRVPVRSLVGDRRSRAYR